MRSRPGASGLLSGFRLSVGLLTVVPAGRVATDRRSAQAAVRWAPFVGLGIGLLAAGVVSAAQLLYGLGSTTSAGSAASADTLLPAALGVLMLAATTRALHLDGLADTADGLGSAKPADAALDVMRRSDIGPFGVVSVVAALLLQTLALGACVAAGRGSGSLVLACVMGRLAVVWACRTDVPAARADGLGALVAGTVSRRAALGLTAAVAVGAAAWGLFDGGGSPERALHMVGAAAVSLLSALLLLRRCVRRLGGITGDVLGALVEVATTATLLALAARV